MRAPTIFAALAIILGGTAPSLAQQSVPGAVELSNGTKVAQNPSLPKLNLTNTQREQIRKAVLTEHNEVEFRLKATGCRKEAERDNRVGRSLTDADACGFCAPCRSTVRKPSFPSARPVNDLASRPA